MVQLRHVIGLACLIFVAAAAAQLPAFVQQYLQRLGGHLDEARYMAAQLADGDAFSELPQSTRQAVMHATDERIEGLARAHDAIVNADEFSRPLVFLAHVDDGIAAATWHIFEPGLPLGWGGALYGLSAAALAFFVYAGCRRVVTRRRRTGGAPLPEA